MLPLQNAIEIVRQRLVELLHRTFIDAATQDLQEFRTLITTMFGTPAPDFEVQVEGDNFVIVCPFCTSDRPRKTQWTPLVQPDQAIHLVFPG